MEPIKIITFIIKLAVFVLIAKIVFDFALITISLIIKQKKRKLILERKLNILKALELYWMYEARNEEVEFKKQGEISVKEICTMNQLSEKYVKESLFLEMIQQSEISYCFNKYLLVSRTNYAKNKINSELNLLKGLRKK